MMLRFWLAMLDAAHAIRAPRCVYLWILGRASDATDWGEVVGDGGDRPW